MTKKSVNVCIRMDSDLKEQADALFNELGMTLSTAFTIFVRQSLRRGGIPFEIKLEQPEKNAVLSASVSEKTDWSEKD